MIRPLNNRWSVVRSVQAGENFKVPGQEYPALIGRAHINLNRSPIGGLQTSNNQTKEAEVMKDNNEKSELFKSAMKHADNQLTDLIQALSTDRAFHHTSENYPHEYVGSIMNKLRVIRYDLNRGVSTSPNGLELMK